MTTPDIICLCFAMFALGMLAQQFLETMLRRSR